MIRGIYNSSSSMQYLQEKMDIVANNLANVNTAGFKRSGVLFNQHMVAEQAKQRNQNKDPLPEGNIISYIENTQGAVKETGNPLDLSLTGKGFFSIQTPEGKAWNSEGSFTLDSMGYMTTMNGDYLMGDYGPIQVNGEKFSISDNGDVMVDNNVVNKIKIENFDLNDVVQIGDNLLKSKDDNLQLVKSDALVKQGYLEISNVSIVKEMVEMIALHRQFQANEKAIKTNDEALNKAVNNIAR
ncbi:MAG: flagellar hook-basal body protein [Candidatus Cloacimonetes bacterium]|nr:flagellar hook-basal body protein [Candidatus Cloacimonadota bacterium]